MEDRELFRQVVEKFILFAKPGGGLDLAPLGRLKLITDRKLSFLNFKTGDEQIWLLPEQIDINNPTAGMKLL